MGTSSIMKVFALIALVPLVAGKAAVPFTAFGHVGAAHAPVVAHAVHHAAPLIHHASPIVHHAPGVHHAPAYTAAPAYHAAPVIHHAPAYHAAPVVHHAPVIHHAPSYHPAPSYHEPKYNCSVVDVVESAEVCTPAFETVCETILVPVIKIIDREQCCPVTRTVCSESVEVIPNEICVYIYQQKVVDTTAKTVEVPFEKKCNTQMVTVCQPTPGYGYHSYGHNYCKEVAQETCYNIPIVTTVEPPVQVAFPEPIKTCVDKPIDLIRISCEDLTAEKCITVPEVEEGVEEHEKCITQLAAPNCINVDLTLPKQVCKELNYGYAEDTHKVEAPAPAPYAAPVVPAYAG